MTQSASLYSNTLKCFPFPLGLALGYAEDLGIISAVNKILGLAVRSLVHSNGPSLLVDGQPVIWVRGFDVPTGKGKIVSSGSLLIVCNTVHS